MGINKIEGDDPTGMVDQARKVEEWARKEIYAQGLEDRTEVFDYLVDVWRTQNGISQFTDKRVLLHRLHEAITATPKKPDNRAKIKEITERLKGEFEDSSKRSKSIYKSKISKLEDQLADAIKTIKRKDRALKSATTTKKSK